MKKNKKRKIIIISIICFVILAIVGIFTFIKIKEYKENKFIENIKKHYNKYVLVNKDTKLYDKNSKEMATIKKGFYLELNNKKINDVNDIYFSIKDSDYYIYFEDVKKTKKEESVIENNNYLVFNQSITSDKKLSLYLEDKKILEINHKIELPIRYMDDNNYYVLYLNKILSVKKDDKIKIIDSVNTEEKESEYISVIHYDSIYKDGSCNKYTCINLEKIKEQIKYLKENNYYQITIEEYNKWLDKKIRLKEKAVLLTTNTDKYNEELYNEFKIKLELITENNGLSFYDENKKTIKDTKKNHISRYSIKNDTTIDTFKKMVNGEEIIIKPKTTSSEQKIAVLNYHFFYDSAAGEGCNENICLDVKNFREQLNYLKNNNFKTLTMDEFRRWMYGEIDLPKNSVLITIDDGAMGTGKHNGNKLIPILEEYNMHATLFLISGWWDVNNYRSPNLDIQSHTYDMHQYGTCGKGQVVCATKEELLSDLQKSLSIVDNNNSFCFPFYSYSDLSIQVVKEAGFKMSFIGGNRKAARSNDKYKIPRYPIYKNTSLQQFINMVN